MTDYALLIARKTKAAGFPLPEELDPANITDPKQIGVLRQLAPLMEDWAEAVKKRAWELAVKEGWDIPGFKKAHVNTKRVIQSAEAAWGLLKKNTATRFP